MSKLTLLPYMTVDPSRSNRFNKWTRAKFDVMCYDKNGDPVVLRISEIVLRIEIVVYHFSNKRIYPVMRNPAHYIKLRNITITLATLTGLDATRVEFLKGRSNFVFVEEDLDIIRFEIQSYRRYTKALAIIRKAIRNLELEIPTDTTLEVNADRIKLDVKLAHQCGIKLGLPLDINLNIPPSKVNEKAPMYIINYKDFLKHSKVRNEPTVPNPMICSWDIEAHSNDGTFPNAVIAADVTTMISAVYERLDGNPVAMKVYMIYNKYMPNLTSTVSDYAVKQRPIIDKYRGFEVVYCATEEELINEWFKDLIKYRVTVYVGFNTQGFDVDYIEKRISRKGMTLPNIGFIDNIKPKVDSVNWESSAFGINTLRYFAAPGILNFDLMLWARQSLKLNSYSLNEVAKFVLNAQKVDDITYQDMFKYWDEYTMLAKITKYYHALNKKMKTEFDQRFAKLKVGLLKMAYYSGVDSELVYKLVCANILADAFVNSSMSQVDIFKLYGRGMQIKVSTLYYNECQDRKYTCIAPWDIDVPKSGGKVFSPQQGVHPDTGTWDFSSLYPSIIRGHNMGPSSLILNELPERIRILNKSKKYSPITIEVGGEIENDEMEGVLIEMKDETIVTEDDTNPVDLVHEANISGIMKMQTLEVKKTKIVLNFDQTRQCLLSIIEEKLLKSRKSYKKSMKNAKAKYQELETARKIIQAYKLSKQIVTNDTSINEFLVFLHKESTAASILIKQHIKGTKEWTHYYMVMEYNKHYREQSRTLVQPDISDIPIINLDSLINEKDITKWKLLYAYYDSAQKAVKVLMNSIYGSLGARYGILSCLPIATAIPTVGRYLIVLVAIAISVLDCKLIYGDTDSVMIQTGKNTETLLRNYLKKVKVTYWNEPFRDALSMFITDLFKEGITIEFEKHGTIIIFKKKRYTIYQDDGKVLHKGTSIVRRDKNIYNKELTKDLIHLIRLPTRNIYKCAKLIIDRTLKLLDGDVSIEELVSTRRIGSHYSSPHAFIPNFIKNCNQYSIDVKPGDRVTLLVTKGSPDENLGRRCLTMAGVKRHEKDIDYLYYAWNDIRKGIEDIWLTGFMDELVFIERYNLLKVYIEFISKYMTKINTIQSLSVLSSDINIDGTLRSDPVSIITLLGMNETMSVSVNMTDPIHGMKLISIILKLVSIKELMAHLLVIYPVEYKHVIKELKKMLNFLNPRTGLQITLVKAIVKQYELARKHPEKYKFGPFRQDMERIQYDIGWERYFEIFKTGKSKKSKDVNLEKMLTKLGITEIVFLDILKQVPSQYIFSESKIPKLKNLKQVLSPFGHKAWRDLKMQAFYETLEEEE